MGTNWCTLHYVRRNGRSTLACETPGPFFYHFLLLGKHDIFLSNATKQRIFAQQIWRQQKNTAYYVRSVSRLKTTNCPDMTFCFILYNTVSACVLKTAGVFKWADNFWRFGNGKIACNNAHKWWKFSRLMLSAFLKFNEIVGVIEEKLKPVAKLVSFQIRNDRHRPKRELRFLKVKNNKLQYQNHSWNTRWLNCMYAFSDCIRSLLYISMPVGEPNLDREYIRLSASESKFNE